MRDLRTTSWIVVALLLVACAPGAESPEPEAEVLGVTVEAEEMAPSLVGSYRLVRRILDDGTEILPPDVSGMMTYTATYRNFNVMWKTPAGEPISISYVAMYELADGQYREEPISWITTGPEGVSYEVPAEKSEAAEVMIEEDKITFDIKGEPVVLSFFGDTLVATAEGEFTDYWTKID